MICPVCDQSVVLTEDGRWPVHERVVTVGKPPRRCPMSGIGYSDPDEYDDEDA